MKKSIIFLAVMLTAMAAGCSQKAEETAAPETTGITEAVNTGSIASIPLAEAEEETEAEETETEETEAEETDDTEADTEDKKVVYQGDGYSFSYDPEKWLDYSSRIGDVSEAGANAVNADISAEYMESINDGLYLYADDKNINFNVVVQKNVIPDGMTIEEIKDAMEQQFDAIDGFEVLDGEVLSMNGIDIYKAEILTDDSVLGTELLMTQFSFILNGKDEYIFTYTAMPDNYSDGYDDFEEILNSLTFDGVSPSGTTEVYKGSGYSLSYDSSVWTYSDQKVSKDDDCVFRYSNGPEGAVMFAVTVRPGVLTGDKTLDSVRESTDNGLMNLEGFEYLGSEEIEINGVDVLHFLLSQYLEEYDAYILVEYFSFFPEGGTEYSFALTAVSDYYDEGYEAFEKVLDSVIFDDNVMKV